MEVCRCHLPIKATPSPLIHPLTNSSVALTHLYEPSVDISSLETLVSYQSLQKPNVCINTSHLATRV